VKKSLSPSTASSKLAFSPSPTRAENQFSKILWDVNICLDKESLGTVAMGLEGNFTFDSTENTYVLDSSAIESVEVVFTPDFTHGNQPHFKAF